MDFNVLGSIEVSGADTPVRIGSRMQRRLLAVLLANAGSPVSAERLIDILWEGDPPPSAPSGLHTYISRLRGALGDDSRMHSDPHGYRLQFEPHELDAWRFEGLVAAGREQLADQPAAAAATLREALALWRGPAYGEFAEEEFARPEAVRLEGLRMAATEDAFAARLAGHDRGLIPDLAAHATIHPLRERPHAQLMTALARAGRQNEALEVFQQVRRRLADETGLEPSPELQQVQTDILQQAPSVMPRERSDSRAIPGELHDIEVPGNLPRPVTGLLGRRHETEAVCRLLDRDPLVTLTGVGGVGKTRLALEVAALSADAYPHGTWWCELAPADNDAVGHAVATILNANRTGARSLLDGIIDALVDKRLLLVLDNCEHVVEASARLAGQILRSCPQVTILATSRQPLAVDGEQVWVVPPLPLPSESDAEVLDAPSAQLFRQRATAQQADFDGEISVAAIGDICRKLDGLPLAIELAAALVPAIEPAQIARRLGQRFRLLTHGSRADPRHRSLSAVVEWSYQLLDPSEQRLFARLSVFAGGFTLDAAEGVCADDQIVTDRVAGLLAGLVSRSMVVVDRSVAPVRYHLLETLRQYADQRLPEFDEAPAMRARHATWFVELAERADRDVRGPGEEHAVALIESELPNLRAAQRWTVEENDADLALRLAAALYAFAIFRQRDEVFVWAEQAAGLTAAADHPLRPTVLGVAAHGVSNRGDLARTVELAELALEAVPPSPETDRFAALHALGTVALYEGRLDDCRKYTDASLIAARERGDDYCALMAWIHEVLAHVYNGQPAAGLAAAASLRAAADAVGNPNLRGWSFYAQAEACGDDDPEQALHLLERAVALAEPVHGRFLQGVARVASTSLRARHRSAREALSTFPDLISQWLRADDWIHQWTTLRNLVPLLVRLEADEAAAVLYGAQRAAQTAAPTYGADADRLAEARQTLEERLGADTTRDFIERGCSLGGEEAVELALGCVAELLETRQGGHGRL